MGTNVQTVLGTMPSDLLGLTFMHEHVVFGYPGYQGDKTCTPRVSRERIIQTTADSLRKLRENFGLKTIVDATPNECGRDVELLRDVSRMSGVNIICSSGYYYEGEGGTPYYKIRAAMCDADTEIYQMMKTEATQGVEDTGIKTGVLKVASSKDTITTYEQMFFKAAGRVSGETNVPIITHTQEGTMGEEQAELLIACGACPKKIMIGHIEGNAELQYYLCILQKGVNIGFDRISLEGFVGTPTDRFRVDTIANLIKMGYSSQIMLSHDYVFNWLGKTLPLPEKWNWDSMFTGFVDELKKAGVTNSDIKTMLEENPKRFLER